MMPFGGLTLDAVGIAEGVERVLTGGGCRGHIGNHHCACLVARERVPQHLHPITLLLEGFAISSNNHTFSASGSVGTELALQHDGGPHLRRGHLRRATS